MCLTGKHTLYCSELNVVELKVQKWLSGSGEVACHITEYGSNPAEYKYSNMYSNMYFSAILSKWTLQGALQKVPKR